ncbi:MAG: sigma-70 family RNA polymerase sigma factor [Deltaproteobacteria bacterium]|nr:sigma-70 family RNA polymerase sigma factor [Deltaproteobacteria bacterium]
MASDISHKLLEQALSGQPNAVRSLIEYLAPVVKSRIVRTLTASAGATAGRDLQQEVLDLTQEVFAQLFINEGKILHSWDPERGLSLRNFVGMVAQRHVLSVLRSRKRNPFTDEPIADCDPIKNEITDGNSDFEEIMASRDLLRELVRRLATLLSPLGLLAFELIIVRDCSVSEVQDATGLSPAAIYMWRSRLVRFARQIAEKIMLEQGSSQRTSQQEHAPT